MAKRQTQYTFLLQYTEQIHYLSQIATRSNDEILKDIFEAQRSLYRNILSFPQGLYGFASILPSRKGTEKKEFSDLANMLIEECLSGTPKTKFDLDSRVNEQSTDYAFQVLTGMLDARLKSKNNSAKPIGSFYNEVHSLINDLEFLLSPDDSCLADSLIYPYGIKTKSPPDSLVIKGKNLEEFHKQHFGIFETKVAQILDQRLNLQILGKELMNQNLKLVLHTIRKNELIKKYNIRSEQDYLKIIGFGNSALINSAFQFDYRTGNKFSTYAEFAIDRVIKRKITEDNPLSLKMNFYYDLKKFNKTVTDLESQLSRTASDEEILEIHVNEDQKLGKRVFENLKRGKPSQRLARLEGLGSRESDAVDILAQKKVKQILHSELENLPVREREVIKLRFELNGIPKNTLEQLSIRFNMTKEGIRQIEVRALKRLRSKLQSRSQLLFESFDTREKDRAKHLIFGEAEEY